MLGATSVLQRNNSLAKLFLKPYCNAEQLICQLLIALVHFARRATEAIRSFYTAVSLNRIIIQIDWCSPLPAVMNLSWDLFASPWSKKH